MAVVAAPGGGSAISRRAVPRGIRNRKFHQGIDVASFDTLYFSALQQLLLLRCRKVSQVCLAKLTVEQLF